MAGAPPTLGIGAFFFIVSALFMPFAELWRTVQGRSSRPRWRLVARNVCMAIAMLSAVALTLAAIRVLVDWGVASAVALHVALGIALVPPAYVAMLLVTGALGAVFRRLRDHTSAPP